MIIAVVGPSGAGKDMLIDGALRALPGLRRARRTITRPADAGGEDYEAVSLADFATRCDAGAFALHWQAHGLHYGIARDQVEGPGDVLFNGSRAALPAARAAFPDLRVLLVTAPPEVLAARLAGRGREAGGDLRARLERAACPLPAGIAAIEVVNDASPETGLDRFLDALRLVRADQRGGAPVTWA